MKIPTLSPVQIVGAVVVVIALVAVITFLQDPFGLRKRHEEGLERRADVATDNAVARGLETEGERQQSARVDGLVHEIQASGRVMADAVAQARSAPDANQPIEPARAQRLHDADRELCNAAPRICGAAPAANGEPGG